jgi:hypothetical protein
MITTHLITYRIAAYPYPRLDSVVSHHRIGPDPTSKTWASESNVPPDEAQVGIFTWIGFEFRKAWSLGGGVSIEDHFVIASAVSEQSGSLSGVE